MSNPTEATAIHHRQLVLPLFFFITACIAAAWLYFLGLPGSFMFDDYPNLKQLGTYGGIHDLGRLKLYLDDAFAGPTGRPISMLTFLIDARDWPADPGALKLKNVFIHVLNGILLFWFLFACLRHSALATWRQAIWIAALTAAWWLLHPLHVSTVLYTIQRMAELSTLFVLAGLIGYTYGRARLQRSPRAAYLLMGGSLIVGTVLATFSKENGALLPVLALVVEHTVFSRNTGARPDWRFRTVFLWLPLVALVGFLISRGFGATDAWELRALTPTQHLLTEARILMVYLKHLLVPWTHTQGMFPDLISVSKSLVSPISTLFSVATLLGLAGAGFFFRRRLPLLSAAILFFLAGHLIESTILPLELYFEHRNYLPSLLLFLPLAQLVVHFWRSVPMAAATASVLFSLFLGATLAARADLWGNRTELYLLWADENPQSPRAQVSAANVLQRGGYTERAIALLEGAKQRIPKELTLRLHLLRLQALHSPGPYGDEAEAIAKLAAASAGTRPQESLVVIRRLTEEAIGDQIRGFSPQTVLPIWIAMEENPQFANNPTLLSTIEHHIGWIYLDDGQLDKTMRYFDAALERSGGVGMGIMQGVLLASNGHYCKGMARLDSIAPLLETDPRARLRADYYRDEIERLREVMQKDAQSAGKTCGKPAP